MHTERSKLVKVRNSTRSLTDHRPNPVIVQVLFLNKTKTSQFDYTFQYSCDIRPDLRIQPTWYSADSIEKCLDMKLSLNTTKIFQLYSFMKHRCIAIFSYAKFKIHFTLSLTGLLYWSYSMFRQVRKENLLEQVCTG